ncbi:hypothetical protein N9419_02480 [Candidatus Pelagibacter sp.]|jgi:dTDP-4-amino-4,6-dideoxy-D-glucose ammonia-lyase|nr:hypothetical protein [Candidatus Pelagibacter sp.]
MKLTNLLNTDFENLNLKDDNIRNFFIKLINKNIKNQKVDLEKNLSNIIKVVHLFSNDPLIPQEDVLEKLSITKNELIEINSIIRNNSELQNIILKMGSGERYWNSILPFAKNTKNVLNDVYGFPLRIAFFPGVSCMFYCGFCGRNQDAKYPSNVAEIGINKLKSVIDEINVGSTAISISGGLEPLTNQYLGSFISHTKNKGLRVPLITNAYSLTSGYIKKNPGLWDLDSLRVSLYGVDENTYDFVTRSKRSYKMVSKNIIEFLKIRKAKNKKVKLGLNFIVLKENIKDIKKLCDFIYMINKQSETEIDFLTLREDFGSVTGHSNNLDKERKYRLEGILDTEDRKNLLNELNYLEDFKKKYFPKMNIDYGYALNGLINNKLDYHLVRAEDNEVTKRGYSQLSVAIDLLGDVFLYREAGFLNREGNKDYIIGRIEKNKTLKDVISSHLRNYKETYHKDSNRFLDSFDHLMTKLVTQASKDKEFGIPFESGPVMSRTEKVNIDLGNNWYS